MRSRARLIEVLKTVNRTVYPSTASRLLGVLQCFERGAEGACLACQDSMQMIAAEHPSPHIREHDVGHCVCGIRSMLHNMEEAIAKAETKP